MKYLVYVLQVLSFLWICCDGAKILCIFPTPSYSHQIPQLTISRALAARGHDLTVINLQPSKVPIKNHRDVDLSDLNKKKDGLKENTGFSMQERSRPFIMSSDFPNLVRFWSTQALETPQVQALIKEVNGAKFDLIIYENMFYSSFLGFSELVGNPPVIGILTLNTFTFNDIPVGNPIVSSYMPSIMLPYSHQMSFLERMENFLMQTYLNYLRVMYIEPMQEVFLKKYFGDVKHTAYELERNISLMIVTTDLASSYPKALHPNIINVGPVHLEKPKPLPQDIQKWMDEAEDGVIFFSLGSNMQGTSIPLEKRNAFIQAFARLLKTRVLWKWESDTTIPGQPSNVLLKKWLPQQSILAHPNLRVFVSQVGLQSLQESTSYAVPILGVPIFGDQEFNAKKVAHAGAGRVVEFDIITADSLYENLKELLTNNSYKENMMRLSRITEDKPMPALETAVWWIEYVLRHQGAPHLRPACSDLTWYQYYCVDVVAALAIGLLSALYLVYVLIKNTLSRVFMSSGIKLKTS